MDLINNPYSPGAGVPPPELAGRENILRDAENVIKRVQNGHASQSLILLGLRGVGKTVLLNRIDQIAENLGCETSIFEADMDRTLPQLLTQQLHRLLLKIDRRKRMGDEVKKAFSLLQAFAGIFRVHLGEFELGVARPMVTGDLAIDLTDLLVSIGEAAKARNTVAVILIDEVQYLAKDDLGALIMALHKISQRKLPLLFFGAGLPQFAQLAGDAKSYSERLFTYPAVGPLDPDGARMALEEPARREGVEFEAGALEEILRETEGYPFFLQVWGSHVWQIAQSSPITAANAREASRKAEAALDESFFKVRFERLTERQQHYARAMAEFGNDPANSTAVANLLGLTVKQAAPIRDEVIKKGMAYSPKRGLVAFTVPKFDQYMKRKMPDFTNQGERNG
ncbi:ATP-binding protein [Pontiella sp.]|uniref:ATP-binding protein n=1 Tax=Pontiella sp. TaxID=2837462 RepID=UPI00356852B9